MAGKLIVLEGTDGSGKSTQFARLCRRLEEASHPFHRTIFPRYDKESSALVRMYLGGEFGNKPGDVNAYAASAFYAVDRYAAYKQDWGPWYEQGGLVMADRYTTSNAVHQASKLPPEQRAEFFRWLYDFEFDKLGLPRPDAVVYLDMPTDRAVSLLRSRENATHTKADIHEVDDGYLARCRETALEAAQVLGWHVMPCVRDGQLRSIEEIHEDIWALVSDRI